ncbi:hypothetical protein BMETH_2758274338620, partial [methanotrophic bacterial endosymbiont of Bathymodiolus sp.]
MNKKDSLKSIGLTVYTVATLE